MWTDILYPSEKATTSKVVPSMGNTDQTGHFMQRFSSGMTTDNHPLYGIFLSRLSSCIFEWYSDYLLKLRLATSAELSAAQRTPTQAEVDKAITKKDMALHCRRKTI